ncbi:MAG: signal peptidase II [Coriobacteriia bacterium]|nr:signal peptidase II [Coriobacteriia bacterium]
MKKRIDRPVAVSLFVGIFALLLIADRFTKIMAVEHLSGKGSVPFIPYVLDFYLTYNQGAAFGIFQGAKPFFIILAFLVCIGIFTYLLLNKKHTLFEIIPLALIGAGALGNAIDRLRVGEVVDFIRTIFMDFPIFNVADSCITVGVIIFILYMFVGFFKTEHTPKINDSEEQEEETIESFELLGDLDEEYIDEDTNAADEPADENVEVSSTDA